MARDRHAVTDNSAIGERSSAGHSTHGQNHRRGPLTSSSPSVFATDRLIARPCRRRIMASHYHIEMAYCGRPMRKRVKIKCYCSGRVYRGRRKPIRIGNQTSDIDVVIIMVKDCYGSHRSSPISPAHSGLLPSCPLSRLHTFDPFYPSHYSDDHRSNGIDNDHQHRLHPVTGQVSTLPGTEIGTCRHLKMSYGRCYGVKVRETMAHYASRITRRGTPIW